MRQKASSKDWSRYNRWNDKQAALQRPHELKLAAIQALKDNPALLDWIIIIIGIVGGAAAIAIQAWLNGDTSETDNKYLKNGELDFGLLIGDAVTAGAGGPLWAAYKASTGGKAGLMDFVTGSAASGIVGIAIADLITRNLGASNTAGAGGLTSLLGVV